MTEVRIMICDLSDPSSYVCKRVQFWFRKHNLDWDAFKTEGLPVDTLLALNDQTEMIKRLEKTARRRLGLENV